MEVECNWVRVGPDAPRLSEKTHPLRIIREMC
jgi:hypothetical protein